MQYRFARVIAGGIAAVVAAAAFAVPAGSSPIDDKRAEAARIAAQIDANGERIAAVGEQYNGAQYALAQAQQQIRDAQARLDAAKAQQAAIRARLARRAADLYKGVGSGTPLRAFDASSVAELSTRSKYASAAAQVDDGNVAKLADVQELVAAQQRSLTQVEAQARAQRDAAVAARQQLQSEDAQQRSLLAQVQGELGRLVAQEQARREQAARAAALAQLARARQQQTRATAGRVTVGSTRDLPTLPNVPVSPRVAAVLAYARAQIGKPYVYATAGPDTFDCSGLTMMAWAQAGVSMPHFSGAQFSMFPHVPLSALQPGDLVFKGPGGRDHVAIYVGGGMQIAATHTGSTVKLQPLLSGLSGAVRPG